MREIGREYRTHGRLVVTVDVITVPGPVTVVAVPGSVNVVGIPGSVNVVGIPGKVTSLVDTDVSVIVVGDGVIVVREPKIEVVIGSGVDVVVTETVERET